MQRLLVVTALLAFAALARADGALDSALPFCPSHGDRPDSNGDYRCDECGFDGSAEALPNYERGTSASPDGGGGTLSKVETFALAFVVAIAITVVVVILVVLAF